MGDDPTNIGVEAHFWGGPLDGDTRRVRYGTHTIRADGGQYEADVTRSRRRPRARRVLSLETRPNP